MNHVQNMPVKLLYIDGRYEIEVGGADIADHASHAEVIMEAGRIPQVRVQLNSRVVAEFSDARVQFASSLQLAISIIRSMDPSKLEYAAMNTGGFDESLGAGIVNQIIAELERRDHGTEFGPGYQIR